MINGYPTNEPGSTNLHAIKIEDAIRQAFADEVYPGDDRITVEPPEDYELRQVYNDLQSVEWRHVPDEALARIQSRLQWLTPAARRYYLPAFLRGSLHGKIGVAIFALCPPPDMRLFLAEYGAYSTAQKQAIREVLEFLSKKSKLEHVREASREALERYWSHFEPIPTPTRAEPRTRKGEVVLAAIEAFADVAYPGDDSIAGPTRWLRDEINRDFRGHTPLTLPYDVFKHWGTELFFFSPEGIQYYMPRFILEAVDDLYSYSTDVLITCLLMARDPGYAEKSYDFYTPEQKHAVRFFLEYMSDVCLEAREGMAINCIEALDVYWKHGELAPETPPPPVDPARKAAVERAIRQAFTGVPYSPDYEIFDSKGVRVEELTPEILIAYQDDVWIISAEGEPYYMSTLLLAGLEELGRVIYKVVDKLQPWVADENGYVRGFLYTPTQRRAVVQFLEYVRDCIPHRSLAKAAQRAIDLVWAHPALNEAP